MRNTHLIVRLLLIVACLTLMCIESRADSVTLDSSTSLFDGTQFTAGTNYFLVFQLVGGGTDNNVTQIHDFAFGGGSALPRDPADPSFGMFTIGPVASDLAGIGQANATLELTIASGNASALFSQTINAGIVFSFDFSMSNNFIPGNTFDAFTFQLYSADLQMLLYEKEIDIIGGLVPVPEPPAILLLGSGITVLATVLRTKTMRRCRYRMSVRAVKNSKATHSTELGDNALFS